MTTLRSRRDVARRQAETLLDVIAREMRAADCDWRVVERDAKRLVGLMRDANLPVTVGEVLAGY